MELTGSSQRPPLTRRGFLKTVAATSAVAGGGLLSACSRKLGSTSHVTLLLSDGGPYAVMPSKKKQKASVGSLAYAEALQSWLDKNPGVTLKKSAVNVWDQGNITTALSGGTAPALFFGDVLGGWDEAAIKSAFLKGLTADVTSLVKSNKVAGRLADSVKAIWARRWSVGGKCFGVPVDYNIGVGIHYRRDLIQELGLEEPQPGWTWPDVRRLAKALTAGKRKGIALQGLGLSGPIEAEGLDLLSVLPAPDTSWHWRWDYTSMADTWIKAVQATRDMHFVDDSVLADVSFGDGDIANAFVRGQVAMHTNSVTFYTTPPSTPNSMNDLAKHLGKTIDEVVGFVPLPVGTNGYGGKSGLSQGQVDAASFSPDLADAALDKAFDLHLHMMTAGYVQQSKIVYEKSKDLREVYYYGGVSPVFPEAFDRLPGSPDKAWGKEFMDTVRMVSDSPLIPKPSWYLPAEQTDGPSPSQTQQPINDQFSKWWFDKGASDIRAGLEKAQKVQNQQADGFTSSASKDAFVGGVHKYFTGLNDFWRTNSPEFYNQTYRDWYDRNIQPVLGS